MQFGASFSHRHLQRLGLNPLSALNSYLSLGFAWIRLGCYWDEIEPEQGNFTFDYLDQLIGICTKNNLNIVLTVGMKAPRWPEFYFPSWHSHNPNSEDVLPFIQQCVSYYQTNSAIKIWQVENEPLDPSGPEDLALSFSQLKTEVDLVRKLDPRRKLLINLWGNQLSKRHLLPKALQLADIIGLDLYPKVPHSSGNKYFGPNDSTVKMQHLCQQIKSAGKDLWITELQAEPWENDPPKAKLAFPPSFLPQDFIPNLTYAKNLDPSVILLWGFEWWYQQKLLGRPDYWNQAIIAIDDQDLSGHTRS